jgi:SAM-dependent methyltransferase
MPAADNLKGQTAHRWKIPSLYLVRGAHLVEDILPYYAEDSLSAMFHDLLAELEPGCKGDAAFYLSLLRTSPADILELGCGSGRLSLALSKHGHNVQGIDTAEAMLRLAKFHRSRLARGWAQRVSFTTGDMTTFSFPRKFDLIVAPYFALNHLPSEDAVLSTFTLVADHLVPSGYFSLHVADTDRLSRPLEQEAATRATIQYDTAGSRLQLDIVERHLDPATKCCSLVLRYSMISADGAVGRTSSERLTYRAIEEAELDSFSARAGLCRARGGPHLFSPTPGVEL